MNLDTEMLMERLWSAVRRVGSETVSGSHFSCLHLYSVVSFPVYLIINNRIDTTKRIPPIKRAIDNSSLSFANDNCVTAFKSGLVSQAAFSRAPETRPGGVSLKAAFSDVCGQDPR